MDQRIKLLIVAATSTIVVAVASRECVRVHNEEAKKRAEIERNMHLDLQAIREASNVMHERLNRGEIRTLGDLGSGLQNEIAFQKIAIREQ